ncbi:MAG TPA: flagellar assembly protein FliW [Acidimicrobiales bacterium]|nr:flagellar assembly protein FliW [Acidimicrobiales bacterium]
MQTGAPSDTILGVGLDQLAEDVVLEFTNGLPGFPSFHRFVVRALAADMEPFARLQSLDQQDMGFVVVPPGALFPNYTVTVDDEYVEVLGIESPEDVVVLTIVTLAPPPYAPTVNLLGPIVVNRRTWAAAQVVQHGTDYGVAVPLSPSA